MHNSQVFFRRLSIVMLIWGLGQAAILTWACVASSRVAR